MVATGVVALVAVQSAGAAGPLPSVAVPPVPVVDTPVLPVDPALPATPALPPVSAIRPKHCVESPVACAKTGDSAIARITRRHKLRAVPGICASPITDRVERFAFHAFHAVTLAQALPQKRQENQLGVLNGSLPEI